MWNVLLLMRLYLVLQLQLSDNKLLGGFQALCRCPSLTKLGLAGNRIADLQELKVLVSAWGRGVGYRNIGRRDLDPFTSDFMVTVSDINGFNLLIFSL